MKLQITLLTFLFWALYACSQSAPTVAAPLGEIQTLEKLASSYRNMAKQLSVAPSSLIPKGKRKFVEQVFSDIGYSYSATLLALAKVPIQEVNQHHRDMKELLFLPHAGLIQQDKLALYSTEEQQALAAIEQNIK